MNCPFRRIALLLAFLGSIAVPRAFGQAGHAGQIEKKVYAADLLEEQFSVSRGDNHRSFYGISDVAKHLQIAIVLGNSNSMAADMQRLKDELPKVCARLENTKQAHQEITWTLAAITSRGPVIKSTSQVAELAAELKQLSFNKDESKGVCHALGELFHHDQWSTPIPTTETQRIVLIFASEAPLLNKMDVNTVVKRVTERAAQLDISLHTYFCNNASDGVGRARQDRDRLFFWNLSSATAGQFVDLADPNSRNYANGKTSLIPWITPQPMSDSTLFEIKVVSDEGILHRTEASLQQTIDSVTGWAIDKRAQFAIRISRPSTGGKLLAQLVSDGKNLATVLCSGDEESFDQQILDGFARQHAVLMAKWTSHQARLHQQRLSIARNPIARQKLVQAQQLLRRSTNLAGQDYDLCLRKFFGHLQNVDVYERNNPYKVFLLSQCARMLSARGFASPIRGKNKSQELLKQAYQVSDRLPDNSLVRLEITAEYFLMMGEVDRAIERYEKIIESRLLPFESKLHAHNKLARIRMGGFEVIHSAPDKIDEVKAQEHIKVIVAKAPDSPTAKLYRFAIAKGDPQSGFSLRVLGLPNIIGD